MVRPRRGPFERVLAWLYTGPLGHFWSVVADLAAYAIRRSAMMKRMPGGPR